MPTHVQRSVHQTLDEVRRVRAAIEAGESQLTELEWGVVAECASELGVNGEAKLQEVLTFVTKEGG